MRRIVYYNINYKCNNSCKFCFSYNVGLEGDEVLIEDLIRDCSNQKLDKGDLLIINGGEPTLYSDFSKLLSFVQTLECNVVIYSNGVLLNGFSSEIYSDKIKCIVPIHGTKNIHDELTRVTGSYDKTIQSLQEIQKQGIRYDIKIILSEEAIREDIDFGDLLVSHGLCPENVIFARMNETKKSKQNQYIIPSNASEKEFFLKCVEQFKDLYSLTFLDFPPCYLSDSQQMLISKEAYNVVDDTEFFYNDCNIIMHKRKYLKKRLYFRDCLDCKYSKMCDLMSTSYYVMKYSKTQKNITLELE